MCAKHTKSDSLLQRNLTKCLTRPLTKAAFHKITLPSPPCSTAPPLSRLFRALFRGGLILFDSLVVILSSVNLSFFVWDYRAEYQGNTNPKNVPILCSLPQRPFPLPLISLFLSTQKAQRVDQSFSPSHQTTRRR